MAENSIKKPGAAFCITIAAAILIIIGLCLYIANSSAGSYFEDMQGIVITLSILAVILCAALVLFPQFTGKNIFIDIIIRIAIVVFLAVVLTNSLSLRVEQMGYTWFSDLEKNPLAQAALSQFLISWLFYIAALIAVIIVSFTGNSKKNIA